MTWNVHTLHFQQALHSSQGHLRASELKPTSSDADWVSVAVYGYILLLNVTVKDMVIGK